LSSTRHLVTRRSFLEAAAPFALGVGAIVRGQTVIERGRFNDNDIPLAQEQLLAMVNEERSRAGLNRLKLDELACKVASEHAAEMAKLLFLSHWGADGASLITVIPSPAELTPCRKMHRQPTISNRSVPPVY